jgi:hypothetical protein
MGKTFEISKIASAPKAFLGFANRINKLIKAVDVISKMRGDGNINVAVSDDNIIFSLGQIGEGRESGGGGSGLTFLFVRNIEGNDVAVDFGVVGKVSPSNIDTVATLTNQAEIWLKVVISSSGFNQYIVDSVIIESGASTPESDAPNSTTGEPGSNFYLKLAEIKYVSGNISDVKNTGNGSFGFAPYITGTKCVQEEGEDDEIIDIKNISFYRMQP